jgi:DNA polymerase zeta
VTSLLHTIRGEEKRLLTAQRICSSCTATAATEPIECVSIDCPWLFERKRLERRMDFLAAVENRVRNLDIESERTVGF